MAEIADGLLRLGREVDEVLVQDPEHAIERTIDFFDFAMVERLGDDTGKTGIDDGGGASGLAHQDISYEFGHGSGCG